MGKVVNDLARYFLEALGHGYSLRQVLRNVDCIIVSYDRS